MVTSSSFDIVNGLSARSVYPTCSNSKDRENERVATQKEVAEENSKGGARRSTVGQCRGRAGKSLKQLSPFRLKLPSFHVRGTLKYFTAA